MIHIIKTINIFQYLRFIEKRKTSIQEPKVEEGNIKYHDCNFTFIANRRIASLIICSIAYTLRSMYFYRVEEVNVWEYMEKKDFEKSYNDLKYLMLFLDGKCNSLYKNYKSFKIFVDK